jgi:hypothetical protein
MCKKNVFLWMALAVICLVSVSCERDGVYQPKKKISKVYYDYESGKDWSSIWVWDGNKLTSILKPGERELQFFYDGNQIDSICELDGDVNLHLGYYKFTYDKNKRHLVALDHYVFDYWNGTIKSHYEFIYDKNGHVSELNIDFHSSSKSFKLEEEMPVLQIVLPQIPQPVFCKLFSDDKQNKSVYEETRHVSFEYEGNNIVKCICTYAYMTETYEFTYSNIKNPFCNLLSYSQEWPFPYLMPNQYMLISATGVTVYSGEEEKLPTFWAADFDYDVEDEYPTRMTYRSRYCDENQLPSDTSYSTATYYFEYLN